MNPLGLAATSTMLSLYESVRGRRLSVLIFHRVHPRRDPLFPGEPDRAWFDRLMGMVAQTFTVLPLAEGIQRARSGTLPPRALAITFDDGYADNFEVALPVLLRHRLCATFFIATGFLDGGRMWNDSVIESVRSANAGEYDLTRLGAGRVAFNTDAERRLVAMALLNHLKYQPLDQRDDSVALLGDLLKVAHLPDTLMMTSAQVKDLAGAGMQIGGHTVRHPILARTPDAIAAEEIGSGRETLRSLTGDEIPVFAYPNGVPERDFTAIHVDMVRRAGFLASVTTARGVTVNSSDPFRIPRFSPWDQIPARWMTRLAMNHCGFSKTTSQVVC